MKVVSEEELKISPAKPVQNPVLPFFSLSLLVLSLFVLLTACSDRSKTGNAVLTATSANTNVTKAATVPPTATAPSAQTTVPATSQPAQANFSNNAPVPTSQISSSLDETLSGPVVTQPVITFSPQIVQIGQSVEISGAGYPANTRLNIRLASADYRSDTIYASVMTDETGAFTTSLNLEALSLNSLLTPGKIEIAVTTTDNRVGASAPLALRPTSDASQDEACKNLVSEFFATLKRDSGLAQVYLSADLRGQIASGKTSLSGLLGAANPPLRVEISKVKDTADSYRATMFFSGGEQKSVVLDVSTDLSGALKISAIKSS